jgi:UDP-GlcNAc:undecaprenyl-phosphate GlcNAc-1-phosphate transferase
MKFILPFLFSFLLSIVAIGFLLRAVIYSRAKISEFRNLSFRKRFGGAVVILVFILVVLLNKNLVITKPIEGILIGGLLILLFGLWDDLKNLNWKWQLIAQMIVSLVAISLGVKSDYVTNPWGGVITLSQPFLYFSLFTLYFLLFINSLNWLDGLDGLSGSVTLVGLAVIFFLSLLPHVNQPAVAILSAIAGGAILGFLVFNWHPAKIMAGTSGAWFFGFLLASLSIFAGAKIATVLLVSLIPILDLVLVVWKRYRAGNSIFQGGDSRHLHYQLLKLGLKERQIVVLVSVISAIVGLVALNLGAVGKVLFIAVFSVVYFLLLRIFEIKISKIAQSK